MTRLGCYLTAMNGDVRKPEIAAAQGYFAMMTRAQEIAKQQARPPAVAIDPILAMCTAIATMRQEQIDMRQAQLAGEAESTS